MPIAGERPDDSLVPCMILRDRCALTDSANVKHLLRALAMPLPLLDPARFGQSALKVRTQVTFLSGLKVALPKLVESIDELGAAIDENDVTVQIDERRATIPGMYLALCQENGIDPIALGELARLIHAQDVARCSALGKMLQEARDKSAKQGVSLHGIKQRTKNGADYDRIHAFDETAEHIAQRYPEYFDGRNDEDRLFELLTGAAPVPISRAQAFEQAYRYLQGQHFSGPISDEPIPD